MSERAERVAERVNAALHTLFGRYQDLYLLGEDISDPYGGAFKVTRNLSSSYPGRVLSTPISENGIMGVAGGLALCGNRVIVEVMFGDFIALAFDQIANFAAKSVTMYGHRKPMRLVIRCPVGGHRGYGPTHSQSLHKHFIGIPNLAVYELSAYHDPATLFEQAFERGEPAIIAEHKLLYGQRAHREGQAGEAFRCTYADPAGNWAHIHPVTTTPDGPTSVLVLAPGGSAGAALDAARAVMDTTPSAVIRVLVPGRLYPLDITPILPLAAQAGGICVVEESTVGGTWGTEVARHLYERLWGSLPRPITLLNSADSIIPTAPHLEREVLLQVRDIESALRALLVPPPAPAVVPAGPAVTLAATPAAVPAVPVSAGTPAATPAPVLDSLVPAPATGSVGEAAAVPVTVPKLNNNDDSYVLVCWLADDGATVSEGDPLAEIETSKALEELAASGAGVLRHTMASDSECRPGEQIGLLLPAGADAPAPVPGSPTVPAATQAAAGATPDGPGRLVELDRGQQQVAQVVTASHRDIPAAYALRQASLDNLIEVQRSLDERDAEPPGLLELIVKLAADQYPAFPLCFATAVDERHARIADGAHVGVTMDAGNGLYIPVIHHADRRSLPDVADDLADYRLRALRGTFTEDQLQGASIAVSWNHTEHVVLVQPLIPPGLACVLSVGGPLAGIRLDGSGQPVPSQAVNLGLAHDHRLVNGAAAVAFLDTIATALEDRATLEKLAGGPA